MKKLAAIRSLATLVLPAFLVAATAQAADRTKADNATALDQGGSWVSGTAPGTADWAIWNGTYTPANCTNSVPNTVRWGGIRISNVIGAPIQAAGNGGIEFYGLSTPAGVVGIDMANATVDLTLGSGRMAIRQNQAWNVAAGRTLTYAQISSPWAFNLNNGGTSYNLTLSGDGNYVIVGQMYDDPKNAIVAINGPGAVTLAAANYVTKWTLNGGTLNFKHAYAISGNTLSTLTLNGGTLDNTSGATLTVGNRPGIVWNGDFTFAGTANLSLGSGPVTLGGNRQVTVTAALLTVAGAIDDGGAGFGFTKAGAGTLALSAESTYTGSTIVSGGTLVLNANALLRSSRLLVGNGATFDLSSALGGLGLGASQMMGGASTAGTGTFKAGAQPITLDPAAGLTFQADGVAGTVGGLNVAGASASVSLNDNAVTVNVTGAPLGASTNILMTVEGSLVGTANPAPVFAGMGLQSGCVAMVITTAGSPGQIDLVITNQPQTGELTTTTLARTAGVSPQIYGSTLVLTATVTGTSTSPGGNVVFKNGSTVVATVPLTPGTSPASTASYTNYTSLKVAGSPYAITAYYSGDAAHNFSDSSASPIAQLITPKALAVSGITADLKTYDGTTNAKLSGIAQLLTAEAPGTGSVADGTPYVGDTLAVGGSVSGTLAARDVGDRAVTITSVTLAGPDAGNYTLVNPQGLVQTVIPKALTVTGLACTNKLYDGTTAATLHGTNALQVAEAPGAGTTTDGKPYTNDVVSLTGTPVATFAQAEKANNIPVSVTGISLAGANAGNYSLTLPGFIQSIVGPPGDQIRADNSGYTLQTGAAWVSGTQPDGTNWAIWTGPYAPANLSADLGGNVTWGGIMVSNVTGGPVEVTGGSTLTLNGLTSGGGGINIVGANDLTLNTSRMNLTRNQSWNVAAGSTFTWARLTSPWAFNLNSGSSYNLTLNGGGNYVFSGQIYDDPKNAIVTMNGPGTVTLAGANYATRWTLNGGTLNLNGTAAISGNTASALTINGGTIDNTSGGALTMGNAPSYTWNANLTFVGTSDLNLGTGAVTLGGHRQVTVNAGTLTVGGAIGDAGQVYSLTKAGAGTLLLSGANTYSGNTTVNEGTLVIAQAKLGTNSTITVADAAVLQLNFTTTNTVANLVLNGVVQPAGIYSSATSAPFLAGAGSLSVKASVAPAAATLTYTLNGSQLVLNWPAGQGWRLLVQTNSLATGLGANWFNVPGATPPYTNTVNRANPTVFFRLTYP
jgi:autotransporter-associated beta strand protein